MNNVPNWDSAKNVSFARGVKRHLAADTPSTASTVDIAEATAASTAAAAKQVSVWRLTHGTAGWYQVILEAGLFFPAINPDLTQGFCNSRIFALSHEKWQYLN